MRVRTLAWAASMVLAIGLAGAPSVAAVPGASGAGLDLHRSQLTEPAQRPSDDGSTSSDKWLVAVSALSPDDVWAVGVSYLNGDDRTLIQHFDGTGWTRFRSPNPGTDNDLYGVTALAPEDVWAVGATGRDESEHPLILHWDGSTWSRVQNSITDTANSGLYGVVGVGPSDIWAVGRFWSDPMVVHWDGTSWSQEPANNGGYDILEFDAITAVSPSRLWLIGNGYFDEEQGPDGALAQQWDGTDWTVEGGGSRVYYDGISGSSRRDVWVAADKDDGTSILLHWNGSRWRKPSGFPTDQDRVDAVADRAPGDVWLVGIHDQQSAAWHYDGATWSMVMSGPAGYLDAVDATSDSDVWAVGGVGSYPGGRCLIAHWNGTDWTTKANCAGYRPSQ